MFNNSTKCTLNFEVSFKESDIASCVVSRAFSSGVSNSKYLAFDTPNTKISASWGVSNAKDFGILLQYRLKCETVWTQMPNETTNFLFNLFSLLSIFYSTFSLSSHRFVSLQPMFSLSFFFRSDSLTLKSTVQRRYWLWIKPPSPIKPPPSLLFWRLHRCWSKDTIVVGLMLPLPPWSEAACRLDLNPSQPQL